MFNVGDFVTFFSLDENFEHVHHDDVNSWVNVCSWYKVIEFDGTHIKVCPEHSTHEARHIPITNVFDEYQVFTKEGLRNHLKEMFTNNNHAAIIAKIRQLYRKQEFQFKGV